MRNIFMHEDSHLNPEAIMVLNQITKKGGRGATTATVIFNLLYLAADENGEVTTTRAALAEYSGSAPAIVSAAIKVLSAAGLIEYKLSRSKSGSLFRLNPRAVSVGKKYHHLYFEHANVETGEISKKRSVEYANEFKRLCERYDGNHLCPKMITAERKVLKRIVENSAHIFKL